MKFQVLESGKPAESMPIRNAYLLGSDGNAMRADISFANGCVEVLKREPGSAALALQISAGDCGDLTLQTCLLPEREEHYLLMLELARHRMMLLLAKLEEWGMFDLDEDHPVTKRVEVAKKLFIEALCIAANDPAKAAKLARESLVAAIDGSEELALAHAKALLDRRHSNGLMPRNAIGCGAGLQVTQDRIRTGLNSHFDFVQLPMAWRQIAPEEGEYQWDVLDGWVEWATKQKLSIVAGPVVSFDPSVLPDWIYIWEHDYETMRDMVYEHVERVVTRYRDQITTWNVVSGLHVNSHFSLSFDQLIEMTRMSVMVVKKVAPQSKVIVEIREPFGEYYSRNNRSIPPQMYADLMIQGAIHFDAFSVKLLMGQAMPGQYTRDLMQISGLFDQFAGLGKPIRVTVGAPSETVTEMMIASPDPNHPVDPNCGHWRKPWSPTVQGHWLEAVMHIALSKPYIESVAWNEMGDHEDMELPLGGLVTESLEPKPALRRLVTFRKQMIGEKESRDTRASGATPKAPGTAS